MKEWIEDLGSALSALKDGLVQCKAAEGDIQNFVKVIEQFKSPLQFAYHVGKDLLVNGKDIYTEITTAVTDWKAQSYRDAGIQIGEALEKLLVGQVKVNAEFEGLRMAWDGMAKGIMAGGCKSPGACGLAYQGCCFGAGHSGDACTCKLTDGSGEVGSDCSGTDKAGACGVAYTACCVAYKVKGNPCTCDVEKP